MNYENVFLVGTGSFLPGEAVSNEDIDQFISPLNGKSARLKSMILKENGIEKRYYGIDQEGNSRWSLAQMGANSAHEALKNSGFQLADIELLTTGTCGGDVAVPGFANMLQGELNAQPLETSSHVGICAAGIAALRHAADSIELKRYKKALVTACEFPSRMFKKSRFVEGYDVDFDSHFLRWMLSDGAGSFVLSSEPSASKPSLKVNHIHYKSFSGDYPSCMYIGSSISNQAKSYLDYPSLQEAEKEGAFLLRQNIRMLPQLFELCLHEYAEMIRKGIFKVEEIDHFVCHYSSQKFESVMDELLRKLNVLIPREKWYSNLRSRGNMGAASIFIMLDDFLKERKVKPGEKILCFIPESGRFSVAFVLLEVVGVDGKVSVSEAKPPASPEETQSLQLRNLLLELSNVWHDYRSRVWRTPFFAAITKGTLTAENYHLWIENWLPQVREGSKWMRSAISNIQNEDLKALQELIELHASEEQNDWKILFNDYKNAGGKIADPDLLKLNAGGLKLNQFMYERSQSVDAVDLLGGIYIIEGTGQRIIPIMLPLVRSQLALSSECFKFLQYHGANDENHLQRWLLAIQVVLAVDHSGDFARKIVSTARTVANLYCQQMEEIKV